MKKSRLSLAVTALLCILVLMVCMGIGSVEIPVPDALRILFCRILGRKIPSSIPDQTVSILWSIRLPRALTAFLTGGALCLSGAIMQAVLQNPLASSYTLGVSSGASLGAAIVIVSEISIPVIGRFLLPASGFAFGLVTVLLVLAITSGFDQSMHSNTVILPGMVVSLFANALMTLVSSFAGSHSQQLILWQMGSFSGKRWYHVLILFPVTLFGLLELLNYAEDLDIMSFGDEQAGAMGVEVRRSKKILLLLASLLTGVSVCFSGTIGFVDLIVPHLVRRIYGSQNRRVVPMCFFIGGAFLAACDMVSRTLIAPREIPVGAVTAIIGAPFFIWLYLKKSKS